MGHYVYKYVKDGEIIYIGKNDTDLHSRIKAHSFEEKFHPYLDADVYYCVLANATMSDVVESALINEYKPKLNVAKKSQWSGLDLPKLHWTKYIFGKPVQVKKKQTRKQNKKITIKVDPELYEEIKWKSIGSTTNDFIIKLIKEGLGIYKNREYQDLKDRYRSLGDAIAKEGYAIWFSDGIRLEKKK